MRQERTISKLKKYAVLSILLCLCVLTLLNVGAAWLEERSGLTADMTDNKLYSLSEDTKRELGKLSSNVDIYSVSMLYGENTMLEAVLAAFNRESDQVNLYRVKSHISEKILEKIGVDKNAAQGNYIVVANEDLSRYQLLYEDDMFVKDDEGMNIAMKAEMKVTSAMKYVATGVMRKIKLLSGHMETSAIQLTELWNLLDNTNSQVEVCQLSEEGLDPQNDLLLVIGPKTDLEEEEYEKITEFLGQGGNAVFMMSRAELDQATGTMKIYLGNMERFNSIFKEYGIQVNQDMVMSNDLNAVSIDASTISMALSNHPICQGVEDKVVMSQCGSVTVGEGAEIIASTSPKSYSKELSMDIATLKQEEGDKAGPFGVAAVGKKGNSTIVVYSSASMAKDGALSIEGNKRLVMNTIEYAWEQEDSLEIGSKNLSASRGMDVPRAVTAILSVVLIPMLVVLAGIWTIGGRNKKGR